MKAYEVTHKGVTFQVLLSDEEARKRGLTPVQVKDRKPLNKARAPRNK